MQHDILTKPELMCSLDARDTTLALKSVQVLLALSALIRNENDMEIKC